jgi:hypothetical protein
VDEVGDARDEQDPGQDDQGEATTTVIRSWACSSTKIGPLMPRTPGRGGRAGRLRPRRGSTRSSAASSTGGYEAPGTVQTAPRSAPDTSAAYLAMAPLV